MNLNRIYIDLEYIYPEMTRNSGRPTEKNLRQIIQIAALKVCTDTNEELGVFNKLCKPKFTPILPAFFTELTNITQEDVNNNGIPFLEAFASLVSFCKNTEIYTMDADYSVLSQNCSYYGINNPLKEFTRVKPMLASWGLDSSKYTSGTLYQATQCPNASLALGHVHNALHDVRSLAFATHYFTRKTSPSL